MDELQKRIEELEERLEAKQLTLEIFKNERDILRERTRWISVNERLPEKTGEYLILPYVRHLPTLWWQDGWYWYDRTDDAISDTVGHNMEDPLPVVTHWKPIKED